MNIINPNLYNYWLPWGNSPTEPYLCNFHKNQVHFDLLANQLSLDTKQILNEGWYRDKNWIIRNRIRHYQCGMIVSKDKFGFGIYEFEFSLPDFRGSWPAIWLLDIDKRVNILPEIDIMEQFVKNCWWKHKLSINYQDGPNYENNFTKGKSIWSCKKWSKRVINIRFVWDETYMRWVINGKEILRINKSQMKNFPITPMNLIVNSGVGNWKPSDNLSSFIITKMEYSKL